MADDHEGTVATLTTYREVFSVYIKRHQGRIVNAPGDAVLAEFASVVDAVACAAELQRELAERNAELSIHRRLEFRIGVNLGDVLVKEGALYGDGVNIAARLEALAEPGGICISGTAYEHVRHRLPLEFADLGRKSVKNIPEPVAVFRVLSRPGAAAHRVVRADRLAERKGLWIGLGASVLLLATVVAAGIYFLRPPASGELEQSLKLPTGPRIAVLPFTNLSGDPQQDYFSDGITEEIITKLARFTNLLVIARNSSFRYKGQAVDVRQVGQDLGVGFVLEGSVRLGGEQIRVIAQLIDAADGRHLWTETYDRKLAAESIFLVQDEITAKVAASLAGMGGVISRAGMEAMRRKTTDYVSAYECVLRGYDFVYRHTKEAHLAARDCLERAVEIDPSYVEAWAWLAWMYAEEFRHSYNLRKDLYDPLELALHTARRAVAMDPSNQTAHAALAFTHFDRREFEQFRIEAEKAIALNPNNATWLAIVATYSAGIGDWNIGMRLAKRVETLDPFPPPFVHGVFFMDHYRKGEYDKALVRAQRMQGSALYNSHAYLAMAYAKLGRKEEARAAIDELLKLQPDSAQKIREHMRHSRYSDEWTDLFIAGLRDAGLAIPENSE